MCVKHILQIKLLRTQMQESASKMSKSEGAQIIEEIKAGVLRQGEVGIDRILYIYVEAEKRNLASHGCPQWHRDGAHHTAFLIIIQTYAGFINILRNIRRHLTSLLMHI